MSDTTPDNLVVVLLHPFPELRLPRPDHRATELHRISAPPDLLERIELG